MEEKTFFTKLYEAMEGSSWSMQITAVKGKLSITLTPIIGKENIAPIQMSGTPAEFDEEFFKQLERPIQNVAFSIQGLDEMDASIKKIQEDKIKQKPKQAATTPPGPPQSTIPPKPKEDLFAEDNVSNATSDALDEDPEVDPEPDEEDYPTDEVDVSPVEPVKEEPKVPPTPSLDLDNF